MNKLTKLKNWLLIRREISPCCHAPIDVNIEWMIGTCSKCNKRVWKW